jgi:hypothetical protein
MRTRAAIAVLLAVIACKDKQAAAPASTPAPTPATPHTATADASAARTPDTTPKAPTERDAPLGEPLSIEDAAKAIPKLAGKEILPLRQTSDKRQVHATWCLDGESADDVAKAVGRQMAEAGYKNLAIRGDAKKAGVQGERDAFRMSMIVSASSAANCPAPKHYFASATIFRQ